jgi:hypothetical protein
MAMIDRDHRVGIASLSQGSLLFIDEGRLDLRKVALFLS